ncbi:3-dehydroquinate dehydratase I / Shikimate 5-dehydrogenase I alpha [Thermogutta terrifontis]|jgi:3-dehydroquinate dehydratase/shikimate dehydrogenase|uniref:Multifunctional fusion protein n=1 Tax=Thermogutta terrifontis TaxID=1331910 RepID=A0A286RLE1_9BACT|nr:shikimate dehydrogenase [Thermogutta terrifontis]ASV76789.1 3-dehydroquinate dehydratase I / Shikimate 5-dehydrogenase I alpha [Thermogutta terrifontis]
MSASDSRSIICVSIARGRHRHVIAEHHYLAEQGVKLVEIRLDYINGPVNVKRLLNERPCPVIMTCRRERDGGRFRGTEQERQLILRTAIAEGVDYIDLEEDIAASIPRYGQTKRIISYHNFHETPENLQALYDRMATLDPDIIKIATVANHPQDNLRMFQLVAQSRIPTVGLCMGDIGIPSRILAGKFGAPFSYAAFHSERTLAPGQLSFEEMRDVYRYESIRPDTEVYGVIADPVGHSLSPLIHNAAFQRLGLNKVYIPIRVPREDLFEFIDQAPQWGIKGLSVTIPHKEAILAKLTKADSIVRGIGAANTVIFEGNERLGYNTDCRAALEAIETALGASPKDPTPLKGKHALVLGAGGAGKAVAYGLLRAGATVTLTDGDEEKARLLAEKLDCPYVKWEDRHSVACDILANCTPVGMHPNVDETPFDPKYLRSHMLVFDAVYNPENTLLIKDARARNCKVVTGVEMFVRQACMQFKLFTGLDAPADLMREVLKRATSPAKW